MLWWCHGRDSSWIIICNDHNRVSTASFVHGKLLEITISLSGLGNNFVSKIFAVQILLSSLEFVIHNESLARLLSVRKLARSWSISDQEKTFNSIKCIGIIFHTIYFSYYFSLPFFIKFSNTLAFAVSELQQTVFF